LVAIYIVFEEFLETVVKPFVEYISGWNILQKMERFLQKRDAYTLFAIYVINLASFSGIKFFSFYLISRGKVYGMPLLITGELVSTVLTVWYFKVAFPILLTLGWFSAIYTRLVGVKNWLIDNLKQMPIYQYTKAKIEQVRRILEELKSFVREHVRGSSKFKAAYRFIRKNQ
jgi:hypothetical protein